MTTTVPKPTDGQPTPRHVEDSFARVVDNGLGAVERVVGMARLRLRVWHKGHTPLPGTTDERLVALRESGQTPRTADEIRAMKRAVER